MDSRRIGSTWRADSPAKLNLFLEVINKRDDGFHEIETLMTATSLYDTLYFTGNQDGTVELTGRWADGRHAAKAGLRGPSSQLDELPTGQENTIVRAVNLLRRTAGVTAGATIEVVKRIPAAAGLGGASSNAAAALRLANHAWDLGWSPARLAELGGEIGSDVPFFLSDSTSPDLAICRGRGEEVSVIGLCGQLHFVVARPPVGLSTANVYRHCRPADRPVSIEGMLRAIRAGDAAEIGRLLFNRLESTAAEISPWIKQLQAVFRRLDLLGFGMSGSGSSFFGICRHHRHAQRLANQLRAARVGQVFAASSVSANCHLAAVST